MHENETSDAASTGSGWNRRDLLRAASSVVLLSTAGCCSPGPVPPPPKVGGGATGIDIHCHVFNARDIPIAGFVADVVLQGVPLAGIALQPLIVLIAMTMDACTWTPQKELDEIRSGSVRALPLIELAPDAVRAQVQQRTAGAIKLFQSRGGRYSEFSRQAATYLQAAGQERDLRTETRDDDAHLLRTLTSRAGAPTTTRGRDLRIGEIDANVAAQGITAIDDGIYGTFLLASLVTERRGDLVHRLSRLPAVAADAESIAMYNPALVDYSYWLDDHKVSSLGEQIGVMSAIAAMQSPTYAVHPWVSFCPWRQLVEPGQFALVQDGVRTKGFIGVKLYPVMGFRPIGNAGAPDAMRYPKRLRDLPHWDSRMDAALSGLYDWCVEENVPIMAHCSFSQFPGTDAGLRGAPAEWENVLKQSRWRDLRLNLGHLGGFWDLAKASSNGWTAQAVAMLRNYPNVYADAADDSDIVERTASAGKDDQAELAQLAVLLGGSAAGLPPRKKLMYGTDWVMLSRSLGIEAYLADMRDRFAGRLAIEPADFLGLNASRFLGLNLPRPADKNTKSTTQRLEDFYAASGRSADFLKRWQPES